MYERRGEEVTMSNALAKWHTGSMSNGQTGGHRPMLGQLLVGAGLLPEDSLHECLAKAKSENTRVGEALVVAGHIDSQCLQSTLLAQELVSSGAVTQRTALKLIASTTRNRIPLAQLTEAPRNNASSTSLAALLIDAHLVKHEVIAQVKTQCSSSRKGITQTLQSIGSLSNRDLDSAFHALSMLCDSEISNEQAAEALSMAHEQSRRVQDFLPESQYHLAKPCNSYAELATSQELPTYKPTTNEKPATAAAKASFFARPEFAILMGTILLVAGSSLGNYYLVPVAIRPAGYCSIAAIAAVLMMFIGLISRRREQKNESDMHLHLSNAQDMKSRLTKIRGAAC